MGSNDKVTYLAPSLQQEGFTGATGTTPYKPVSPEGVQALQNLYNQPPLENVKPVISPTAQVININLDGTQNNGWFPAPGESPTNVFQLSEQHIRAFGEDNTIYLPGVGAPQGTPGAAKPDVPASNLDSVNWNAGPIANSIVNRAYNLLVDRVAEIRQQDPNAEISINLSGFSRGAAETVALANLIQERGIPGLYEAGQTRIDSMLLYDPVDMTNGALNTDWPTNVQNNLVLVAMGESRHIMPAMPLGPGANVAGVVEAAHSNVGGSFNQQGTQAVTLGVGLEFQQAAGMAVADAPAHLQPDWNQMQAHDSSRDNFGNDVWSTHGGERYYEGAERTDPSVRDVINNGAEPPFGKPALVQPPDPSLPQGVWSAEHLPDGSTLLHYDNGTHVAYNEANGEYNMHVPKEDGQGYLVYSRIRNEDGSYTVQQFDLDAEGHLQGQQTGSQSSLQEAVVWGSSIGTVTEPAMPDLGVPSIEAPSTSGSATTAQTLGDPAATPSGPSLSSVLSQAQMAALDQGWGLQGSGLQASDLSVYRQPDGSYLVANIDGEVVGTLSEGYGNTRVFTGLDGQESITDSLGQRWSRQELEQAQQLESGLSLMSAVLGLQNWSELNDVQRLSAVASLYNRLDVASAGGLPGDIGGASASFSGLLGLVNGLENDNALQALTGGVQLVDALSGDWASGMIASGLAEMGVNLPVGQVVPVLNLLMALDNLEENPMGALASMASFIPVYGQVIAMAITVISMFMDEDIPPSIGEAEVHIDESGAVVVDTTRDERDGGSTAAQWAQALGEIAVAVGMSTPQVGAPAQHLPAVGYYYDPDGPNLSESNGHLVLRWTDKEGQSHQRLYDSSGMRWDSNSVEGQSDIVRDYLLLVSSQEPLPLAYQAVEGGILQVEYGVATVLYATALGTYDGRAEHTHGGDEDTDGGEAYIGVGSAQMVSLKVHTVENSTGQQTQRTLGAGEIQSLGASTQGPRIPQGKDPTVFVPTQAVTGGSRSVAAGMVRSLGEASVISDQQLAATAMALGLSGLGFASHAGQGSGGASEPAGAGPAGQAGVSGMPYVWGDLAVPGADAGAGRPAPLQGAWIDEQGRELAPGGTVWRSDTVASGGMPPAPLKPGLISDPVPVGQVGAAQRPAGPALPAGFEAAETVPAGPWLPGRDDLSLDHPTVVADDLAGTEDEALYFSAEQLLANDHTPNPVPQGYSGVYYNGMRVISVGEATHGQVGIRDGQLVFIPDENYNGVATFSYTVQDMYGMTRSGTASIEVRAVNDAPEARGESATGQEDTDLLFTAASLLRNDTDVDGDRLRISRVGEAAGGVVYLQTDGSVRFVPTPDYNGPASYAYWVSDGHEQVRALVRLNILPVNDLPVVQGEYVDSDEDVVLDFPFGVLLANDTDVDTDPALNRAGVQALTISAVGNAQHGTVQIVDGQVRFTPDKDYFGPAAFDYLVDDGAGGQVSTTVILNLAPVNDAPEVQGESGTIAEDNAIIYTQAALLANDSDVDNDHADLRITQVGGAINGSVELLPGGRIRFVPDADYFGPAAFDYLVDDGAGGQALGTVTLDVTPVNDDPRLQGERVEIDEDTVVTVKAADLLANDHDVDNDHVDLLLTEVGGAVNGSVAMDDEGNITFTPTANYYGQASFTYTVIDGVGGSSTATMVLDYLSVNDLPVVNGEVVAGKRGITYTFDDQALLANDTDVEHPGQLQIVAVGGAQNGTVEMLPNGDVRFVPAGGYEGWSPAVYGSFEYTVRDPDGGEAIGVVAIDYSTVNLNPIAVDDRFKGYEDVKMEIRVSELLRNDRDPDASAWSTLQVEEVGNARNGSVSLQNGVVTFNPNKDFYGEASFRYRVGDGEGGSTWATAYIDVERANQAPVITRIDTFGGNDATQHYWSWSDNGATYEGSWLVDDRHRISGRIYAYDPDGDTLTFTVTELNQPEHGVVLMGYVVGSDAPVNLDHRQLQGQTQIPELTDPDIPNGGRKNYLDPVYVGTGTGAYAGWQYISWKGESYSGAESFVITVTDSRGLSTTSDPIQVTHVPWTGGGGGCFPVVVDTGSDGIDLVSPDESKMFVDINGDGWRDQIGWVASTDALLAYDSNDDGLIDRPEEVSFVGYQPGARTDMEGLLAFDSNGDGVLSAEDREWHRFGFLQDANGNGVQDGGEWLSLNELGVKEISLQRDGDAQLNNGNVVFGTSTVTYEDGRTQTAADVMFAGNGVERPEWVDAELAQGASTGMEPGEVASAGMAAADSEPAPAMPGVDQPGAYAVDDPAGVGTTVAASAQAEAATPTSPPTSAADPASEAVASPDTAPSVDQQADAFVQMVSTQVEPSEPIGYVDIQASSLSGDQAEASVSVEEPMVVASRSTADIDAMAVPA